MFNGLELRAKFSPSQTPYAIKRDSFYKGRYGGVVDAIWAGRKNGRTTVSVGALHASTYMNAPIETVDDLIAHIDMRYGGTSHGKWDGDTLITPCAVNESERMRLLTVLVPALDGLPDVPDGYVGWFYNRRRR